MAKNIAIVGATGLVGSTFLQVLEEKNIDINTLKLFASPKSAGKKIMFNNQEYTVEVIKENSFTGIDYALFSAGGNASLQYAPQAVKEGAIVIDNSSAFRMDKNVPLVVPEVNLDAVKDSKLIANPNCSTIQVVGPLQILKEAYGLVSVEYNTYQAVSGSGINGLTDLENTQKGSDPQFYKYNISKTCIPQIDVFLEDGYTKEEHKMMNETRKILNDESILVSATCVRVPVANSHAVSVKATLAKEVNVKEIKRLFAEDDRVILVDNIDNELYPVATLSNGTDNVYVGRIRKDKLNKNSVLFYTVADNIRKGAASNAIEIMLGLMNNEESM